MKREKRMTFLTKISGNEIMGKVWAKFIWE